MRGNGSKAEIGLLKSKVEVLEQLLEVHERSVIAQADRIETVLSQLRDQAESLRDSERRYRLLFDNNPHPMWVYDLGSLAFLAVNDAAVAHYGYSKAEFLSMTIRDIRPREDIPALLDNVRRVSSGLDRAGVWRHRKKDGTIIEVDIISHTLEFDGRLAELVLARDVTDQLRTQRELEASEERYRRLIEFFPDAILVHKQNRIVLLNQAGLRLLGATRVEEILGKSPLDVVHPDYRSLVRGRIRQVLELGEPTPLVELKILCVDGSAVDIEATATPFQDRGETAVLVILRDITERKRAAERSQMILNTALDGFWIVDLQGRILEVNDAYCQLTGYSRGELLLMSVADVEAVESAEEVRAHIQRVIEAGSGRFETRHRRKDGMLVDVDVSVRYSESEGGRLFAFFRDVTERKRLEEQLRQSQKMEAIGRLAGGVAHDFNNLLTVITGYSLALKEQLEASDPRLQPIEEIQKAAERAAALTRQLLVFSRRQVLQPRAVDLNALVTNMTGMLRRLIGEDIEFVSALAPSLWPVKADPSQIEQVIMNLAVNARDAMPDGGTLTIETDNVESVRTIGLVQSPIYGSPAVRLTVRDTGKGIDPETRSHMFEPFFSTKELGKGTGLGLATVYGIVAQSGGTIDVKSEPGLGTAFTIYLPRVDPSSHLTAALSSMASPGGGSETILLVEDEDIVRVLVRDVLKRYGYRVLDAANVQEALQICESNEGRIDLLLTDIVMPGMSGRRLAEEVVAKGWGTRVLFMSGYTDDMILRHGVQETNVAFIQKPFTPDALARQVREVLDRPQNRHEW